MAPALLFDEDFLSRAQDLATFPAATKSPLPKIAEIHSAAYEREQDLINDIVDSLKASGGCLLRGMYQQCTLDVMEKEIRPYIESTGMADSERDDFVPSSTRMVTGLLSKSRTYALSVAGNKIWHRVCDYFLSSKLTNSWVSSSNQIL